MEHLSPGSRWGEGRTRIRPSPRRSGIAFPWTSSRARAIVAWWKASSASCSACVSSGCTWSWPAPRSLQPKSKTFPLRVSSHHRHPLSFNKSREKGRGILFRETTVADRNVRRAFCGTRHSFRKLLTDIDSIIFLSLPSFRSLFAGPTARSPTPFSACIH